MLKAIARIVRTPDLLRKIAFTLGLIAVYRMGAFVPAPGVDYPAVQQCLAAGNAQGGLYSFVNMFSGGALLQVSVFALGIMPYITASIIVQLLRVVIPRFEQLHQEGPQGQATLTQYTRYLTLALALLQATTMASLARTGALLGCSLPLLRDGSILTVLLVVIALTTGCLIVMLFGERITENGVGPGPERLLRARALGGWVGVSEGLGGPAGGLDLLHGGRGEGVRLHLHGRGDLPRAQHLDGLTATDEALGHERVHGDLTALGEVRGELVQVHDLVLRAERVLEAAELRQTHLQGQLAALEARTDLVTGLGALGAATGGLALRRLTATHTGLGGLGTGGRTQVVDLDGVVVSHC